MSKSSEGSARRRNHVSMPVVYAAVGASRAPDLMRFPPQGSTPYEQEFRLGSGQQRFLNASGLLMTWGAQTGAGCKVSDIERADEPQYAGLSHGPTGRFQPVGDVEHWYTAEGEPYLTAGTKATLSEEGEPPHRVLVVFTLGDERRLGFAWGSCDEATVVGERLFFVEHREDDTVWAVARGFVYASKGGLLGQRSTISSVRAATKRQIEALAPGRAHSEL